MTGPQSPNAPTVPGTVLVGKYRVERWIGQGGMGIVLEARHLALDERVALKLLTPAFAQHADSSRRFLREARAAVKIKGEHVARVLDVGTLEDGAPYMVMEYLHGADLGAVVQRQGPLPLPLAVDYLLQACEAIAEAHGQGIIHRDIKPSNLFLATRPDGTSIVKVLDFGISKMQGTDVDSLTSTNATLGSALYMAPEQMQRSREVDQRADVYALGVTLFELLTGSQPFYAETLPQLCAEILTGSPRPLRGLRPDLPEPFARVLEHAYARDRDWRYQSVADLAAALAPFAPATSSVQLERIARLAGRAPAAPPGTPPPIHGGAPAMSASAHGSTNGDPVSPTNTKLSLARTSASSTPARIGIGIGILIPVCAIAIGAAVYLRNRAQSPPQSAADTGASQRPSEPPPTPSPPPPPPAGDAPTAATAADAAAQPTASASASASAAPRPQTNGRPAARPAATPASPSKSSHIDVIDR